MVAPECVQADSLIIETNAEMALFAKFDNAVGKVLYGKGMQDLIHCSALVVDVLSSSQPVPHSGGPVAVVIKG